MIEPWGFLKFLNSSTGGLDDLGRVHNFILH